MHRNAVTPPEGEWADPCLHLSDDPAFASLEAVVAEWDADDEAFLDAARIAPDDAWDDDEPLTVRELLEQADTSDWAGRLAILESLDPACLDAWEAEEYARQHAMLAAHVAYRQIGGRLAVGARCRPDKRRGASYAGLSLAVAEKVSPGTADLRLLTARRYVERLPALVALLGAGQTTEAHLRKVLEATEGLSLADCLTVQAGLADRAPHLAPGQLGKAARRAAAGIDPEAFTKRSNEARKGRDLYVRPGEDGMGVLGINGPATEIALAHLSLDEAARALRAAGDPRPLKQLRCDLALERLQGTCDHVVADMAAASTELAVRTGSDLERTGPADTDAALHQDTTAPTTAPATPTPSPSPSGKPRTKHGRPVKVVVHVDLSTLLHADDTPGEVTGIGPIPAELARLLAAESNDWWRLVLDPTSGVCRDYGRLKKPGQDLTDLIVAKDETCMAPMCDEDIDDLDHITERQSGGLTTEANLEGLSEHCHVVRTDGGWQPHANPDGSVTWTSPAGHEHTVERKDHRLRPPPRADHTDPQPDEPPF